MLVVSTVDLRDAGVTLSGRRIWRDATLAIEAGSITAVLGPNGSGKTTLLNVLLGLVRVDEGSVEVFGAPPRSGSRRVGYMSQTRAADTMSSLTPRDYVGLGFDGTRFGWGRDAGRADAVRNALALTGATSFADRPLHSLSGGQRQRVALAPATGSRPERVLLDGPLAARDIAAQAEILRISWFCCMPTLARAACTSEDSISSYSAILSAATIWWSSTSRI